MLGVIDAVEKLESSSLDVVDRLDKSSPCSLVVLKLSEELTVLLSVETTITVSIALLEVSLDLSHLCCSKVLVMHPHADLILRCLYDLRCSSRFPVCVAELNDCLSRDLNDWAEIDLGFLVCRLLLSSICFNVEIHNNCSDVHPVLEDKAIIIAIAVVQLVGPVDHVWDGLYVSPVL